MGCGVSTKVSQARDPQQNLSGTITINLISGLLNSNITWLGGIEAYVIIYFGKKQFKSEISKLEGNEPIWNQMITVPKISEDELIYIEVWNDHPILDDQFLGSTSISLLNLRYGGEQQMQLSLYDLKKRVCGKLNLYLTFMCTFPNNPLAQQIDYAGFVSLKIKQVNINRDEEIPSFKMNLLAQVSINNRKIGQTAIALNQGQHPIWEENIIGYRESGEDNVEISIYDCNEQTEYELIGSSYISICRLLSHSDRKRVVIWWQGKCVGMLQVDMSYYQTIALSQFSLSTSQIQEQKEANFDEEWVLSPEQAYEQKLKAFELQHEYDISKIRQMKKLCNRPELSLDSAAVQEYEEKTSLKDMPKEGIHTYKYVDGTTYEGEFCNYLRHGKGKLITCNGNYTYDGDWMNDVFHGNGLLEIGQVKIEAQFRRGQLHGTCKKQCHKDQILQGNYKKGLLHGEITITNSEHEIFSALYEEGYVISLNNKHNVHFPKYNNEISTKGFSQIYQQMASDDSFDKEDLIPLNSLQKGLRMTCGQLFSKNMKYCLALTNRGTLKIVSIVRQKEIWNNSYSDPNNRPYFFWINPENGQFQVVSCYGVTFSTNSTGNNIIVMRNTGLCEIVDIETKKAVLTLNDL